MKLKVAYLKEFLRWPWIKALEVRKSGKTGAGQVGGGTDDGEMLKKVMTKELKEDGRG